MSRITCLLAGLCISIGCHAAEKTPTTSSKISDDAALRHAKALLDRTPLIDGHNDLPWSIRDDSEHPMDVHAYDMRKPAKYETDLPRLREGRIAAQFWSVYVPGELKDGWAKTQLEQIDIAKRMIAQYPDRLMFATRSSDIAKARKAGKVASFLGMEGGHVIENSLGALRAYYDLGARYMTLTHNVTLDWVDAALGERKHGGLTPFGKEVVREMNRLGMLVDLSHVSPEVMHQALDVSEAPIIFSHSGARALLDHPRNVPDDVLKRMKANGGIVMVYFVPTFIAPEAKRWTDGLFARTKPIEASISNEKEQEAAVKAAREAYIKEVGPQPKGTLAQVADHIEHIARVAGHDHVGIASDFYGGNTPAGLEDVSTYPALFAELIKRGWKDEDLAKLAGGNLIRTFARAEAVATRLQKERRPSLAVIDAKH